MNRKDIFNKIQGVFIDVFDDENLEINNSTNSEHIEEWDSLNHIQLVLSIEKTLSVRFKTGEIQSLKDVGEMIDMLEKKLNSE